MERLSRRALLAGAAGTLAATAGCLEGGGGRRGTEAIVLPTVAVGGSPGGEVPVRIPGEVALVDFFATWCPPCKPQMSSLGGIREDDPDLHMISITQETDRAAIEQFWRDYNGTWPVAIDAELVATQAYGVDRIPTMLVLDPEGAEVWRHSGLARRESIEAAVDEARA